MIAKNGTNTIAAKDLLHVSARHSLGGARIHARTSNTELTTKKIDAPQNPLCSTVSLSNRKKKIM